MQKPAELRKGTGDFEYELYVYGVRVYGAWHVGTVAEKINAAAAAYREDAVLAIKAGGCA